MESEIRLDENGESIDLDGGSSLILECEVGCEELSNLKSGIDSISSVLGNSGDCFVSPQGFSICPETIYDKLHNISSDKIGENNELAGIETLFQLNYLIKDSLTSNFSQFGEETAFGKLNNIKTETDLIGFPTDTSSSETLFGKIADVKQDIAGINCGGGGGGFNPLDPCFIKVMNRISLVTRAGYDPVAGVKIWGAAYPQYIIDIYNYINNIDWTGFCD